MPRFDSTRPFGQGPIGRGLGPCGAGRRTAFGMGFGRGFRGVGSYPGWNRPCWGWAPIGRGMTATQWSKDYCGPQDEVQFLKQEASYLQNERDPRGKAGQAILLPDDEHAFFPAVHLQQRSICQVMHFRGC